MPNETVYPKSNEFNIPAIPYARAVKKPDAANNDSDPYGLFVAVDFSPLKKEKGEHSLEGVIITPPTQEQVDSNLQGADEEVVKYSGANLTFDISGNIYLDNKQLCSIDDTVIGVSKNDYYIYLLRVDRNTNTYQKLWVLPPDIYNLLLLNRIPINYSFAIEDNKFTIIKINLPRFIHDEHEISASKTLNLEKNVELVLSDLSNEKESLENTFFTKNGNKYYMKDLKIDMKDNNLVVMSGSDLLGSCDKF